MLPQDESLYKRIKMQQVAERLITGTAQTTEHIITNNTGRSFLLLAQMQAGSGDINENLRYTFTEGHYVWNSHGSGNAYDNYFSQNGNRGNFINLNHKDKNFSVIGGSGSLEGINTKRYRYYWHVTRDSSGGIKWKGWRGVGWQDYNNSYKIAREGQKKHIILFFRAGDSIRINFTSFGSSGDKGFVRLTPLV